MINLESVRRRTEWNPYEEIRWSFASASKSVQGACRCEDQDCVIADDHAGIFGVADGVGGNRGGAEASECVCTMLRKQLLETETEGRFGLSAAKSAFRLAVDVAMDRMTSLANACPELKKMSTTLAVGWVVRGRLFYAHAGDSRIYLLRKGQLVCLTEDHSYAQVMRTCHGLTDDELSTHPYRNAILRSIGPASHNPRLDVASMWLRPHDRLLFMTDGITDVIDDETLEGLAANIPHRDGFCDVLVRTAQLCESPDDLSCVVVDCDTDEPESNKQEGANWWEFKWLR